jgi:hypothetical protein
LSPLEQHDWDFDIIYYLKILSCLANLDKIHMRSLKLRATKYCLAQGGLRWRNPDGVILWHVDPLKSKDLLKELHAIVCGGHFSAKTTTHKIMRLRYYWPTLFTDMHAFVWACDFC